MLLSLIIACPNCSYDRVLPGWVAFAALRLAIIAAVSLKRFDLVRIVGAFVLYEIVYYYLWSAAIWYSHPAVSEGLVQYLALGVLLLISSGLPAALLLWAARKSSYLRGNATEPFTKTRAILLIFLLTGATILQAFQSA